MGSCANINFHMNKICTIQRQFDRKTISPFVQSFKLECVSINLNLFIKEKFSFVLHLADER